MVSFGVAIVVVLAVIAGVFYIQRGSHLELQGRVLKVRTAPLDENNSVAVVDFRITNVADFTFTVRTVTVTVEDASGKAVAGTSISEVDAQRLFQGIPLLGQKYNQSLILKSEIPAHAMVDRMIAASFPIPEDALEKRKQLTIRIEEFAGPVSEIREK